MDRGGLRVVDGDYLVLGDIVLRTRSDLQNVVVRHLSFVFKFAFSMLEFLKGHAKVTRDQQTVGKRVELGRTLRRRHLLGRM